MQVQTGMSIVPLLTPQLVYGISLHVITQDTAGGMLITRMPYE